MSCPTVLEAAGGAVQRGRVIGEALREPIAAHIAAWHGAIAAGGVSSPVVYVEELLAVSTFVADTQRLLPHLVDEVRGMAEGAKQTFEAMFALQLIDEEWAYRAWRPGEERLRDKCSSLAIAQESRGSTWLAQNMDLGAYTDGLQLLVRHASDENGPAQLVFTLAGHLGLMGLNAAGVGLCCNSLPQLASARRGLPVAFAVRRVLEGRTAREAAAIARSLPHATNQHFLIADAGEMMSLEASAAGVTRYWPTSPGRVLHTNHPLTDAEHAYPTSPAHRANTWGRLASLERELGVGEPSFAVIAAALASLEGDHPVCRLLPRVPGLINFTTGSMIAELRADTPTEAWVAFGPPSERPYRRFGFAGPLEECGR